MEEGRKARRMQGRKTEGMKEKRKEKRMKG